MSPAAATLIVALFGAWLLAGVAAVLWGVRRGRHAAAAERDVAEIQSHLQTAPVAALIIDADGGLSGAPRAAGWLGFVDLPPSLDALDQAGFDPGEMSALREGVAAALRSGKAFAQLLSLPRSARVLALQGTAMAGGLKETPRVLAWISDVSDAHRVAVDADRETRRLNLALDSLSAVIEAAPFPIWYRKEDLGLALVNSAYVRAVESSDSADVVRRGLELIDAGSEGSAAEIAARVARGNRAAARTTAAIVSGERRMMQVTDVPIEGVGVAGFAVDVQDLINARADLAQFATAQRAMLDRLSAGVAQFGSDRALVFYNRHFLRLFALDADWLADRPEFDRVLERMREAQRAPESRDFPTWRADRRAWFNAAEAAEENWLLPGGTHLRVVAQPLPDGGLLVIFEDRTEHLQLASARDTLLRVRAATLENLFEAIGVFAADGRLHLWNKRFREMWELNEEYLVRHPRVDALAEMIAPRLEDPRQAAQIREIVRAATTDRQHRTGRLALADGRHLDVGAVPLPDGNALLTLLDITSSWRIEEVLRDRNQALEEANDLKSDFVSNMSYELRVPLTTITGYAEMLASGYAGPLADTVSEYLTAILSAVERLRTVIGDGLDLSQSKIGSLPLHIAPERLNELVREATQALADTATQAGVRLAVDLARESPVVAGDRRRLLQCLDHLLRGAIAESDAGARLLVEVRGEAQGEVLISTPATRHDGAEMGEVQDNLLETGLPLVRQLVEAHQGHLDLAIDRDNGLRIAIGLPLAEDG
ncbi:signal transduction histidine kinase [Sphingomonas vulcanisoli]|uniref:histidine kinase n=1 Tax=Sphingomonas vulcanisoli TaxID=1658060 RepID=A0ABX0TM47_9SPHN|nr:PAS domain-containing sensor histidine kinase [Sphingomonas vulcanisoli]NIJ06598.1 signal transduction histidine kinase [Sphingomonas vulcanisoli]